MMVCDPEHAAWYAPVVKERIKREAPELDQLMDLEKR